MFENIMPNIYHYDTKYILLQQKGTILKNQILKFITPKVYYHNTKYTKSIM